MQRSDLTVYISIHALRGEGDQNYRNVRHRHGCISIHALRGEGDQCNAMECAIEALFQSTPSVGRATTLAIHRKQVKKNFNPRPPWGGRLTLNHFSTLRYKISIHALRGEGDGEKSKKKRYQKHFNPRPPWGGRPEQLARV